MNEATTKSNSLKLRKKTEYMKGGKKK